MSKMKIRTVTYLGLFISYFSITGINLLFHRLLGERLNNPAVILRELCILSMVGVLFWLILKREKLSLQSIGLFKGRFKKSLLWALVTVLLCGVGLVVAVFISQQLGWKIGESKSFDNLSPFTITLVVIRAGIAEEVFFRGYIIERLKWLTNNTFISVALSVIPFALFHYSQGYAGILIAFLLGTILSVTYLWKRDLKSNMMAHFTVDFIPNVVLPLFS